MLRWSKILKSIFKLISNKNQPIKPKLSSVERANPEKTHVFMKILHKTPSWIVPPFWGNSKNKNRWYIWGMWTTFQRLAFGEMCCIGKDIGGFEKVDFFEKNRFYRLAPPSWILKFQTQRFFMDTSRTNKTQKRFLKYVENWPFSSNNFFWRIKI